MQGPAAFCYPSANDAALSDGGISAHNPSSTYCCMKRMNLPHRLNRGMNRGTVLAFICYVNRGTVLAFICY